MTTFRSSSPTERAFMRDKHWQHPARRQHIHGKVIGIPDYNRMGWRVIIMALKLWIVG